MSSVPLYGRIVNMHKTLLIMAAGMGSRYGGLKQIDTVGPTGEYLIDYSVYDAWQAGFDKVVFVIREDFADVFKEHFAHHICADKLEFQFVNQRLDDLPAGCPVNADRTKPWGTGHAVWTAREVIHEPFAVISADDFYGREAFVAVAHFLDQLPPDSHNHYAVVGYQLGNTLSENGWVARGLLKGDAQGFLTSIHEHTKIGRVDGQIVSRDKNDVDHPLEPNRLVSMVMFAFTPDFFAALETSFTAFCGQFGTDASMEFFTPNVVNELIQSGTAKMQILPTESSWFGVTYHQDKEKTVLMLAQLTSEGVYPNSLLASN